ncbi:hypothetical protein MNBD_BACTEROID06-973 [hydrothermal vent metagenome]|uniref:Outer membrane protein beta-barrel domain-containing protein n=1 Tax=hydrothermal vent metagenome TaxID=652676 RepID=A0A3B0VBF2_9ZZZZ
MSINKFRKIVFLLVFTLSNGLFAQDVAQTTSSLPLLYGAKIGSVVSGFNNTQPHTGQKLGFMVGGIVEYKLPNQISVQAEPSYMQRGGSYVRFSDDSRFGGGFVNPPVYTTNNTVTIHTVDLPILGKYTFKAIGNFTPNVVLGPSVSFLLWADNNFERTYYYNQTFNTVNGYEVITSEYEPYQIGATAGVGGEVSLGNLRLLIDFRYRYGFTPDKKGYSYIDLSAVQGDLTSNSYYFTIGIGL